jgi:hypothetical protein
VDKSGILAGIPVQCAQSPWVAKAICFSLIPSDLSIPLRHIRAAQLADHTLETVLVGGDASNTVRAFHRVARDGVLFFARESP